MVVYLGEIGNKVTLVCSWACLGTSGLKKKKIHKTPQLLMPLPSLEFHIQKCQSMSYLAIKEKNPRN